MIFIVKYKTINLPINQPTLSIGIETYEYIFRMYFNIFFSKILYEKPGGYFLWITLM